MAFKVMDMISLEKQIHCSSRQDLLEINLHKLTHKNLPNHFLPSLKILSEMCLFILITSLVYFEKKNHEVLSIKTATVYKY